MAWLRWESTMKDDPKVIRAGPWGALAWRAVLEMTKAQEWGGILPAGQVDGPILAHHFRLSEVVADGQRVDHLLGQGLEACVREGLLVTTDSGELCIPNWPKYQPDPTSASRIAKHRARRKLLQGTKNGRGGVTGTSRCNGDVTGRDVTGRDGTGQRGSESKTPPSPPVTTGGDPPEDHEASRGRRRRLSSAQVAELHARGLDLAKRTGSLFSWEHEVAVLLSSGKAWPDIVAALDETRDQPDAPHFEVFRRFRPPPGRRRPAGVPPAEPHGKGKTVRTDDGPQEDL